MAKVSVYNIEGKEVDTIELNDAVFGVEVNEHLVHMAVVNQLANNRQGTQKAKTRSEVSGGGRKAIAHRNGVTKAEKGHFDKAGVSGKRYVKEFRFDNAEEYALAQEIKADIFAEGDHIDATAISKGKGFQGAIKRHGQSRGPMTHGSKFHRHAGSNGAASDPSKVFKGKKMPGQMGNKKITVQNLEIVRVDAENNLLLVKGSVPGPKKCLVTIKETVKGN